MTTVQTVESLLFNHKLRFPHDAAVTEAAHIAHQAMFHTVRSHMEQGLISLAWKTYFNQRITEDDLEVIETFNHFYNSDFEEAQELSHLYLDSLEHISQHDVFEAFEQLEDQLPEHQEVAIQAYEALGEFILTDDERTALDVLSKLTTPGLRVSEQDIEELSTV